MNKILKFLKLVLDWTVLHPFTWDVVAGAVAQLAAQLGWFKPWVTASLLIYLLGRIFWLRGEIARIKH